METEERKLASQGATMVPLDYWSGIRRIFKETEEVVNVKKVGESRGNIGPIRSLVRMILKETEEVVNVGKVVFLVNSSFDSVFQKILIITSHKRTVWPGDAIKDTALKLRI